MDREQERDLPSLSPEQQLAAMGLAPRAGAGPAAAAGQPEDLPNLPPEQQLEAMGVTPRPEAEPTTEPAGPQPGPGEPEVEAYEAERAEAGPPPRVDDA
jgi:hypothetical protein